MDSPYFSVLEVLYVQVPISSLLFLTGDHSVPSTGFWGREGVIFRHAGLPQVGKAANYGYIPTVAHEQFRYSTNVREVLYTKPAGAALIMGPRHPEILADPTPLLLR